MARLISIHISEYQTYENLTKLSYDIIKEVFAETLLET